MTTRVQSCLARAPRPIEIAAHRRVHEVQEVAGADSRLLTTVVWPGVGDGGAHLVGLFPDGATRRQRS
jgi:hypothetical protein